MRLLIIFICTGLKGLWKCVIFGWFLIFSNFFLDFFVFLHDISYTLVFIFDIIYRRHWPNFLNFSLGFQIWKTFCFTSLPIFWRLSFPRVLRSCSTVKKCGAYLCDHLFDLIRSSAFPISFIAASVSPKYRFLFARSTGWILKKGLGISIHWWHSSSQN